ncbi:NAD(P)H-hydrate dehydratase [Aliikangiella sp. G2MR2-5]|uniref:NAD(P)H-hydrate dehydratase n=1 Tax=Aliikangiella sp. G2MR2-5 TaxID=2788943 RepID=UPI0018A96FD3|nr:NAD(P)H-hydrate dehydratase [Aliikangiella sp. G2MR2-5]
MRYSSPDAGVALYSASQIRDIELSYAKSEQKGTYPLMEAAGRAAYQTLKHNWPEARNILILTGKGNNGGDGFVVARLATEERKRVTLCNFCEPDNIKGDALIAYQKLHTSGIAIKSWDKLDLSAFDLVIDAMLGTGIKGALRSPFDQVIAQLNKAKVPVLSIDIPSGLEADTGSVVTEAVHADMTVTYIGHKKGMYTGTSANYRGKVKLFDLGVSDSCYQQHEFNVIAENWNSLKHKLKPRLPAAHKGDHGRSLIIGGSKGMLGAAVLAASAAARCGSGLTWAMVEEGAAQVVSARPEVMAQDIDLPDQQCQDLLKRASVIIAGPGLGQRKRGKAWMQFLNEELEARDTLKVYDADALNWLAENPNKDNKRVLTPHPGEAARLLNTSPEEVNQDRFASCQAIVEQYGGICVLKGAGTIVSDNTGMTLVCPVGNPGMATGGMGDVLSGIVGALLAQGFSLLDSAALGVVIHGEAADRAAGPKGYYRGLLAADLFPHLPALVNPY